MKTIVLFDLNSGVVRIIDMINSQLYLGRSFIVLGFWILIHCKVISLDRDFFFFSIITQLIFLLSMMAKSWEEFSFPIVSPVSFNFIPSPRLKFRPRRSGRILLNFFDKYFVHVFWITEFDRQNLPFFFSTRRKDVIFTTHRFVKRYVFGAALNLSSKRTRYLFRVRT